MVSWAGQETLRLVAEAGVTVGAAILTGGSSTSPTFTLTVMLSEPVPSLAVAVKEWVAASS